MAASSPSDDLSHLSVEQIIARHKTQIKDASSLSSVIGQHLQDLQDRVSKYSSSLVDMQALESHGGAVAVVQALSDEREKRSAAERRLHELLTSSSSQETMAEQVRESRTALETKLAELVQSLSPRNQELEEKAQTQASVAAYQKEIEVLKVQVDKQLVLVKDLSQKQTLAASQRDRLKEEFLLLLSAVKGAVEVESDDDDEEAAEDDTSESRQGPVRRAREETEDWGTAVDLPVVRDELLAHGPGGVITPGGEGEIADEAGTGLMQELRSATTFLISELEHVRMVLESERSRRRAAEADVDKMHRRLEAADHQRRDIESRVAAAEEGEFGRQELLRDLESARSHAEDADGEVRRLGSDLAAALESQAKAERALEVAQKQHSQKLAALEKQLASAHRDASGAAQRHQDVAGMHQREMEELQQELDHAKQSLEDSEAAIAELEAQDHGTQYELTTAQQRVSQLEDEVAYLRSASSRSSRAGAAGGATSPGGADFAGDSGDAAPAARPQVRASGAKPPPGSKFGTVTLTEAFVQEFLKIGGLGDARGVPLRKWDDAPELTDSQRSAGAVWYLFGTLEIRIVVLNDELNVRVRDGYCSLADFIATYADQEAAKQSSANRSKAHHAMSVRSYTSAHKDRLAVRRRGTASVTLSPDLT